MSQSTQQHDTGATCLEVVARSRHQPQSSDSTDEPRALGLLDLPGELLQHIRDCITGLEWRSLSELVQTHLALRDATRSHATIYDEQFWEATCTGLGVGGEGAGAQIDLGLGDTMTLAENRRNRMGWLSVARQLASAVTLSTRDVELFDSLFKWSRGCETEKREPNPLLQRLYMNWWTPTAFAESPNTAGHPSLQRTFWMTSALEGIMTIPTIRPAIHGLAISSLVTLPCKVRLSLAFRPDYNILPKLDKSVRIARAEGIRLVDVLDAMHLWLQTRLTPDQKRQLVQTVRERNRELFTRLEESTDEETLQRWLDRTFDRRGALINGQFAELKLEDVEGTGRATVICSPRDSQLGQLSARLLSP